MNKKIFLLLSSINSYSQTSAPERDTQFWHNTTRFFSPCKTANCDELSQKFLGICQAARFRSDAMFHVQRSEHIGGGIEMKFDNHVAFSPSCLSAPDSRPGEKEYERRVPGSTRRWKTSGTNFAKKPQPHGIPHPQQP